MMNANNWAVKWAVAACVGIAGAAGAANITMNAVEGVWDVATNWVGNVAPTTGDYAIVEGTAYRRVYITNGVAAAAGRLSLAVSTGAARTGHCVMSGGSLTLGEHLLMGSGTYSNKATFTLSGGTASIANGRVAQSGSALFTQTGGTLASPFWIIGQYVGSRGTNDHSGGEATFSTDTGLIIGNDAGASGVYKLSGSGVANVPGIAKIGLAGQGRFEQSGGSVIGGSSSASYISLGNGSTGSGLYLMSGGSLATYSLQVGGLGQGRFEQSGGSVFIGSSSGFYISLGQNSTGNGVYLMSGGSLATYNLNVGGAGSGIMTQSLGTVSVTNFYVPGGTGSGTYVLSQGNLTAGNAQYIGGSGGGAPGLFVQNGGTNFCGNNFLCVGPYNNAPGTYEMNGGEIKSSLFLLAGVANQTNSAGTLNLAAGTMTVNTEFRVGSYGTGTLTQTGGTLLCPGILEIGLRLGSVGTYTQSGGVALLNAVTVSRDSGSFGSRYVISGGTATMTNLSVTRGTGSEGTFGVVGTNAAVTVVQQLYIAAGGAYEVTLTPEGFAAPAAGTLSLSTEARLKVKFSGPLCRGEIKSRHFVVGISGRLARAKVDSA